MCLFWFYTGHIITEYQTQKAATDVVCALTNREMLKCTRNVVSFLLRLLLVRAFHPLHFSYHKNLLLLKQRELLSWTRVMFGYFYADSFNTITQQLDLKAPKVWLRKQPLLLHSVNSSGYIFLQFCSISFHFLCRAFLYFCFYPLTLSRSLPH